MVHSIADRAAAFSLALLLGAADALSAPQSFYFRPDTGAGCAGADGKSYAGAWCRDDFFAGRGGVDWSVMRAGDTLYVCGVHDRGYGDRHLYPKRDGIIIDGNCKAGSIADPGFLLAAGVKFDRSIGTDPATSWVRYPPSGTSYGFYRTYTGSTESQVIEDRDNDSSNRFTGLSRLARQTKPPDASWKCGSFYQHGTTLYYRPSDCSRTQADTLYAQVSDPIVIQGRSGIVVRNLTILNSDRAIRVTGSTRTRIEYNELRWLSNMAIRVDGNSDSGYITGNEIRDIANGIYLVSSNWLTAENNDYWLISANRIHHVDQESYYESKDSHAIGVQGGNYIEIVSNELHHLPGSAVTFYNDYSQEQMGNWIHHNYIHDVKDLSTRDRNERGIEYGNGNRINDASKTQNNLVAYNVLRNIDKIALRTKSAHWPGQACAPGECSASWSFMHNTIHNVGTSFHWVYTPGLAPEARFEGNISYNPTGDHVGASNFDPAVDHSHIRIGRNVFYPDGSKFRWGSPLKTYSSLAAWASASGRCRNPDGTLNCRGADPKFVSAASGDFHWQLYPNVIPDGGDYRLRSGSPAIDYVITGDYDMRGAPISGPLLDAGAYEGSH